MGMIIARRLDFFVMLRLQWSGRHRGLIFAFSKSVQHFQNRVIRFFILMHMYAWYTFPVLIHCFIFSVLEHLFTWEKLLSGVGVGWGMDAF
jgi:hypothetical protein